MRVTTRKRMKRGLAGALACLMLLGTLCTLPVFADDENVTEVKGDGLTEIVFADIFTDADKGKTFGGNLYIEKTLGAPYFDGVRKGDFFELDINVAAAGDYHLCFSFGWVEPTGTYDISVDGGETIHLQNTVKGLGWRDWINSTDAAVSLGAGKHTIRVTMGCDGPNLYAMKIAPVGTALGPGGIGQTAALCDEAATRTADQIQTSAAAQFKSTVPFSGIALTSASWNNNLGSLRFSLYKWQESYNKTLEGTPVATEDFINFADNATLRFLFSEVEAGEYLIYMENISDNTAEAVGSWGYTSARAHVRAYKNGAEADFCPGLSLMYGETVSDPFAPISEMDPNATTLAPSEADLYPWGDVAEYKMNADAKYGVQFKATATFGGCEVFIPTIPAGDNTLTLSLYKWDGNYSTTVKTAPVAAKTLQNVKRSNWATLSGEFGPGEYLFVISDGTEGMTVGMVEAPSDQANHYLHTSKAGISLICRTVGNAATEAPTAPAEQDFITDDAYYWVATDGLDRTLPTTTETGGKREGKYVGIFYHTWHSAFAYRDVTNVTELVTKHPDAIRDYNHPAWEGKTNCFWNEPIWGYYNNGIDRYVLRKQAELLADAGVDVVFFDNTNGTMNFVDAILTLCEVWAEARADGVKTPQISAMLNMYQYNETAIQIKELYDRIYSKGLYQDLWFYWEDKPLLLGYPEELRRMEGGQEAYEFFSYRPINPSYN